MSGSKRVAVSSDAAEIMKALQNYDSNAPSSGELQDVSGTRAACGQTYVNALQNIGANYSAQFAVRLAKIQQDCVVADQILQELQELDADIASEMQKFNVAVSSPGRQPGAPQSRTSDDDDGTTW